MRRNNGKFSEKSYINITETIFHVGKYVNFLGMCNIHQVVKDTQNHPLLFLKTTVFHGSASCYKNRDSSLWSFVKVLLIEKALSPGCGTHGPQSSFLSLRLVCRFSKTSFLPLPEVQADDNLSEVTKIIQVRDLRSC